MKRMNFSQAFTVAIAELKSSEGVWLPAQNVRPVRQGAYRLAQPGSASGLLRGGWLGKR